MGVALPGSIPAKFSKPETLISEETASALRFNPKRIEPARHN
jgi:hypothetical protein